MHLYGDTKVPMRCREERRSYLLSKWKFDCHCQLCEVEETEADEVTYQRFQQLDTHIQRYNE